MEASLLSNGGVSADEVPAVSGIAELMQGVTAEETLDPQIAALPRLLLMGPRRGGKTSIQVSVKTRELREDIIPLLTFEAYLP